MLVVFSFFSFFPFLTLYLYFVYDFYNNNLVLLQNLSSHIDIHTHKRSTVVILRFVTD